MDVRKSDSALLDWYIRVDADELGMLINQFHYATHLSKIIDNCVDFYLSLFYLFIFISLFIFVVVVSKKVQYTWP